MRKSLSLLATPYVAHRLSDFSFYVMVCAYLSIQTIIRVFRNTLFLLAMINQSRWWTALAGSIISMLNEYIRSWIIQQERMVKDSCPLGTRVKYGGSFHSLNKCRGFLGFKSLGHSPTNKQCRRALTCLPEIYMVGNDLWLMHLNHVYDKTAGVRKVITSTEVWSRDI